MVDMNRYLLMVGDEKTGHVVSGRNPTRALRDLCAAAGLDLAQQLGRYGKLRDGRSVMALTEQWRRAHYADARTTRV